MAIIIEAAYSKKVGLPQFSSHQYSVSLRSEISDLSQVEQECARLYALLQTSVDRHIQNEGFVPVGLHESNNGNGTAAQSNGASSGWRCSDKQRSLIEKLIDENHLAPAVVDDLARERFGLTACQLNKLQASGLIEELFSKYGGQRNGSRGAPYRNGNRSAYMSNGGSR